MPVDFDIDDEVDKLHGKVSMLKQMTGAIHDESNIARRSSSTSWKEHGQRGVRDEG